MNIRLLPTRIRISTATKLINQPSIFHLAKSFTQINHRSYSRHGSGEKGLWGMYREELKKQFTESQTVQEAVKDSEESVKKVKEASATIKEAVKPGLKSVGNVLAKGGEVLYDGAASVVNSAPVQKVGEGISNLTGRLAQQKLFKYVIDDLTEVDRENRTLRYNFRSQYGRNKDLEAGIYYNPYTQQFEKVDESTHNTVDKGIILSDRKTKPVGAWRKSVNSLVGAAEGEDNILVRGVKNVLTKIADTGDKYMKPSLESEVLTACKERDSTFSLPRWLANLEYIIAPEVLGAYFKDDIETLKRFTTEQCYLQSFYPRVQSRRSERTRFDTKVLDLKDFTLLSARFTPDQNPLLVVGYQTQYIYHIVDEVGNTIEGGPNDIRLESHIWALRQDPEEVTQDWEIMEAHFGFDTVKIV
ncbi:mitochondrial import inner membrane translocase subunit TIM44 [Acrasis kona]|uniref:Mitochondrial import inner membrane translocase subunit TIM44 n=1 Tax=Acrasis kona TaxID=1008807 RepID=A0AAW2ZCQ8_9EUKA